MTEPPNRPPHLRLIREEDDLDDVLITEEELPELLARDAAQHAQQPPPRTAKRRQFRRFDETCAEKLLPRLNPIGRLALVLLAEADFHRHIKATTEVAKAARLTLKQQRALLAELERLGLISIKRRGSGRAYIVTPLRLAGRPGRK
jgi:hypothetical protein